MYDRELAKMVLFLAQTIDSTLPNELHKARENKTAVEQIFQRFERLRQHPSVSFPPEDEDKVFNLILDEILGAGPLESLMQEKQVTNILVNRPDLVYAEMNGTIEPVEAVQFINDSHVQYTINRLLKPVGQKIDSQTPLVNVQLPDGSHLNAMTAPISRHGSTLTLRKFFPNPFTLPDLVRLNCLTNEMAQLLEACVVTKLNVVVVGGTGAGKTTLLNVLDQFIPEDERVITLEAVNELTLTQPHVVRLMVQERQEGVSMLDLLQLALKMRAERFILGAWDSELVLELLRGMSTGQKGVLTAVSATTIDDAIDYLIAQTLTKAPHLPVLAIKRLILSAVDIFIHIARLPDGSRKILRITEVNQIEGTQMLLQDIFSFVQKPSEQSEVVGEFAPSGRHPQNQPQLTKYGYDFPLKMFMRQ